MGLRGVGDGGGFPAGIDGGSLVEIAQRSQVYGWGRVLRVGLAVD